MMTVDQVQFSDQRWLDFWRNFKGLPWQIDAVVKLGQHIKQADPTLLAESAQWVAGFQHRLRLPVLGGLDPRGKEEEGLAGPAIAAPVKAGDSYLLVNDRDQDMEAFDHTGKMLWRIPALARGIGGRDWVKRNSDTPPGLYRIGRVYADYDSDPSPVPSDTARSYGWYSFDLEEMEGQEARNGRAGIMLHGGGTACGWPGAWAARQPLFPTLGCIRAHNIDLRDKVLPLTRQGTVYVGVFQERGVGPPQAPLDPMEGRRRAVGGFR